LHTHRTPTQSSTITRISPPCRPLTAARYFSLTRWRSSSSPPQPSSDKSQPPSKVSPLKKVTSALTTPHENIYTIPNFLTLTRLIAAPFIGYCIVNNHHTLALSLFTYAGISDLLDGWIARKWNLGTVVGTIIDPLADKTLMTVLTVALATQGSLPVWLAVIILGRDVGLAIAAIYYRWISLPPPKTMSRYWDFSLPSAEVRPTTISKWNTALQLGLMGGMMVAPVVSVEMGLGLSLMQ
jgi:cardiolipin synthase